jgi:hypothetical protein
MSNNIEVMKAVLQVMRGEASLDAFPPEIRKEVEETVARYEACEAISVGQTPERS